MDSAADLPKEGFPHSDIRGSTIARISPQLIAACHVLHRLLAPRHPPNALLSLVNTAARTQYQHAKDLPKRTRPRVQPDNESVPTLGTPAKRPPEAAPKKVPHPASTQQRYRSHLTIFNY